MLKAKNELISGWGLTPSTHCLSYRPEKAHELSDLLARREIPLIARGLGRSYGDAAICPQGVVKTERLDHLLSFAPESGILRAQAGLSLAQIMELFIPRGFIPPTIPGTKYVTLGGAFACNIHGKNQYKLGEFAEHVTEIKLLLADGSRIKCSLHENADLFLASAGGMGMTGIIEEVSLRLLPVYSLSLKAHCQRVNSLEEMLALFSNHKNHADYMVGWIDHLAKGDHTGRGIFEAARHITASEGGIPCAQYRRNSSKLNIPFTAPSFLLNRYTMSFYNYLRFHKYAEFSAYETNKNSINSINDHKIYNKIINFDSFFHPLDAIGNWNRLYGKNGFYQYQCLIPESEKSGEYLRQLLESLHEEKIFSFLAVIKYHRDSIAPLSFSKAGYSVALDLPNNARVRAAIPQINSWIAKRGGRIYLAKDALLSADMFAAMYGKGGEEWKKFINQIDPQGLFSSMMSERLRWKK